MLELKSSTAAQQIVLILDDMMAVRWSYDTANAYYYDAIRHFTSAFVGRM